MFIRKKKNQSGKICVQVIDKSTGKYSVVHTVGSSADSGEVASFVKEAKNWISQRTGSLEIDFYDKSRLITEAMESIAAVPSEGGLRDWRMRIGASEGV